jgi:O-antigen ligase
MTWSNFERAFLIDRSIELSSDSPIFGNSSEVFVSDFAQNFLALSHWIKPEDEIVGGPHNSVLEHIVFFGYPGGVLFLLMLCLIVSDAVVAAGGEVIILGLCLSLIMRHAMFYGFAQNSRFEVLLVLATLVLLGKGAKPIEYFGVNPRGRFCY